MEEKSVSDCFNIIDDALVENIGKYFGISNLENNHIYLLQIGKSDFIEDKVALSNMLSQINSMVENLYQFVEEDINKEYVQWRNLYLVWLIGCSTEPEIDD